jgi:putative endonuclease
MSSSKREEGREGEARAVKTLKKEGYKIIETNYRTRFGEIDIIAEEEGYLVFVEVKKRNTPTFGDPFHAINARKRAHMIKSALFYLKSHDSFNRRVRFDVVGIDGDGVKVIKHAFRVDE